MADNKVSKVSGSRRRTQVQAESSDSQKNVKKRLEKKPEIEPEGGSRCGKKDLNVLAPLWKFTANVPIGQKPLVVQVVAASLSHAMKYMERYHYDFLVEEVKMGVILILSGWPLP